MNCENCDYSEIFDWEPDEKNMDKVNPIYWCERYRKTCSSISECRYKTESEEI